jgi:hypothetical protein
MSVWMPRTMYLVRTLELLLDTNIFSTISQNRCYCHFLSIFNPLERMKIIKSPRNKHTYSILSCAEKLLIWKKMLSILNLLSYVHIIKHSALFKFLVRLYDVVLRHKGSFTCSVFIGGTVGSVMIVLLGMWSFRACWNGKQLWILEKCSSV